MNYFHLGHSESARCFPWWHLPLNNGSTIWFYFVLFNKESNLHPTPLKAKIDSNYNEESSEGYLRLYIYLQSIQARSNRLKVFCRCSGTSGHLCVSNTQPQEIIQGYPRHMTLPTPTTIQKNCPPQWHKKIGWPSWKHALFRLFCAALHSRWV